jgi:hypothetical protein
MSSQQNKRESSSMSQQLQIRHSEYKIARGYTMKGKENLKVRQMKLAI